MLCIECSDGRVAGKCLQSSLREQTLFEVLTFDHYLVFWESYPQYSLDFSVFHRILFGACSKCKKCWVIKYLRDWFVITWLDMLMMLFIVLRIHYTYCCPSVRRLGSISQSDLVLPVFLCLHLLHPFTLKLENRLCYINEAFKALYLWTSALIEAHYSYCLKQPRLDIVDRVNEISISRKESDWFHLTVKGIVYQVDGDCDIHLCLDLPFDLLLASASACLSPVFEISLINNNCPRTSRSLNRFVKFHLSWLSFLVLCSNKPNLVKLCASNGFKESYQDQEVPLLIEWQEVVVCLVQLAHTDLQVCTIYD